MEESGIPTVYLGSCRDIMVQVHAPRSVFLDFPLGRQCGAPHDADLQKRVLRDAIRVLTTATDPGTMVDLDYDWGEPFNWETYRKDMAAMLQEEGATDQQWAPKT